MKSRMPRALAVLSALFMLLVTITGCAQRKIAVKAPDPVQSQPVMLQEVRVADDAGTVLLKMDNAPTYTFYKLENPYRAVIDLAQSEPGPAVQDMKTAKGKIRQIQISKQNFGGGTLTRVELLLDKGVEFDVSTDPSDVTKVSVKISSSQAVTTESPVPDQKPVAAAAALPEEPKAAVEPPAKEDPAKVLLPQGNALTDIIPTQDGIQLKVKGLLANYNAFKLSKPERLVVDLFEVHNALAANSRQIGAFGLNQARVGMTAEKIRVVFDSTGGEIAHYTLTKNDQGLLLSFESKRTVAAESVASPAHVESPAESTAESAPKVTGSEAATTAKVTAVPPPPAPDSSAGMLVAGMTALNKNEIDLIDFKLVDGYSQIAIRAGSACRVGKPATVKDGLALTLANCRIPKNLQRSIDTSAFASVVKGITPYQLKVRKGTDAKLLVKLRAEAPYRIETRGDVTYWEIKNTEVPAPAEPLMKVAPKQAPVRQAALYDEDQFTGMSLPKGLQENKGAQENKKIYTGRRVTLEFSDADIRKIFQLIAEVSNLNFLIGDDVTGQISIKLVNVPWDQALDVILETKQLAMKRDGNIIQIRPKGKMVSLEEEERAAKEALERSMDLKTVIMDVNYAKIDEVANQFNAIKSKRGTITKDNRTNRIIAKDIEPAINDMKFLLKNLDMPERQVMIEARIVEASSNFTRDLGIKWNTSYVDGSASKFNINSADSSFGGIVSSVLPTTTTGGMAMGMSFGKLTSNIQLDMRLSAAATIGQVKVISTPKVLTLNNKKAKISQGQSVPYQTVSAEGTKTEFVEAVLTLEVTPHITSDGSVGMEIKASNNSVGSGTPPPINKKEATTELVVKNGETTVIGGIYIDSDTEVETGVPFLMDIPLLGWMFKSNSKSKNKTELLIFITPKVIN